MMVSNIMDKVQEFDIPVKRDRANSSNMKMWTNFEVVDNYLSSLREDDWKVLLE